MSERPAGLRLVFADEFDDPDLDRSVWLPHYLPAWSSRGESAATYDIADSCLRLSIPPEQGRWCAERHPTPLRVSGIQSGNFSGPAGTTIGQQPFREGLTVLEEQEPFRGWTPRYGYIELRARGIVTKGSMVAFWMSGFEERPEHSAEICVAEIFGNAVVAGTSAAVGVGLKPFRDPNVASDFEAIPLPIDVSEFHAYAIDWTSDSCDFFVDGRFVRRCPRPPTYPLQLMLAVFDFPVESTHGGDDAVPEFIVDHVRGYER